MSNRKAFTARLISMLSLDRVYRVYLTDGAVFFIRIGGQGGFARGIAAQFGALGALFLRATQKRSQADRMRKLEKLDMTHPSAHLSAHKHNFTVPVSEFEESVLQPPPALGGHGQHHGRWVFKLRGQKPMTLQLETLEEMQAAYEILPNFLGGRHKTRVVWHAGKSMFIKGAA